jgi:hypothetical protein
VSKAAFVSENRESGMKFESKLLEFRTATDGATGYSPYLPRLKLLTIVKSSLHSEVLDVDQVILDIIPRTMR